jgi:uncharacterized protein (DUF433 family)
MTAVERDKLLKRIAVDPEVMVGKPVIRGTRLTVQLVLGLLASGQTIEEVRTSSPVCSSLRRRSTAPRSSR